MARPKKEPAETRGRDLTIPVTEDERQCIKQGASAAGMDMATWARPILLRAAKIEMAKSNGPKSDK
jgi:predicted DNA binding CopG/RHH family protein